ncbi:myophilin-like [Ruditapes philippinarum]|uniref:myophilin-like n=1 Tax=Ruditapes philippinarum TaxID=129788 RepID=UPI00295AC2F4|nr:myophilin-like [Ruditapes philippinarum]XP_060574592.1 myophilin-like [Ruditapes philippinarum]
MPPTAAKRDPEMEEQAMEWIEKITGEKLDRSKEYPDQIKDGITLCNLMNKLDPGCIKKIDKKGGGFALMQNIERFNKAILNYGVPVRECFQTVDLWEKKNIPAVTLCIHALGRITQTKDDYDGPVLGPKMSDAQVFDFTPEQLAEAKFMVNTMQYGSNQGASQAGMNMGKQRGIND